ncbi:hypothetical protein OG585_27510 [Streptomyces sp. NBC_01340]|uniref:hypothetical protein n=1 Tax=Streptomyces sp. NBC_01340 TaxID=2903830 RepID=UPI002E155DFC|nr:hypothetical protein OG585_27510 [Streptomyces sp. NBC_01340]
MGTNAFVDSVWRWINGNPPHRDEPIIMEAPQGTDLHELVAEFSQWAGQQRNLAAGGFIDPSLTERTGLPLVEPFGAGTLLEMRGWGYRHRWVGSGLAASPDGLRAVAVIAHREDPATAGFPEGASWAEKLRIATGWEPIPGPRVDWPAIEADLGTRLPGDYKEIVDLFGAGSFDEYFHLAVPGGPGSGRNPWKPYVPDLASSGLLPWGWSEYEVGLMWWTGPTDPDEWTVVAQSEVDDEKRFDCGAGEFILRMLTDVQLGYPMSHASGHFFVSYGPPAF